MILQIKFTAVSFFNLVFKSTSLHTPCLYFPVFLTLLFPSIPVSYSECILYFNNSPNILITNNNLSGGFIMFENEYAEIITVDELCEWLNIGKNTAYVLLNAGDIKAFKIKGFWKIPRGAVVEFINRKSKRPFPPSLH